MQPSDDSFSISALFVQHKLKILISVVAIILSSSCLLPIGYLTKKIIDEAIEKNEFNLLMSLTSIMVTLIIVNLIGTISARRYISRFIKEHLYQLRVRLCDSLLSMSRKETEKLNIANSQIMIVTHIERVDVMLHAMIIAVIPAIIMIAGLSVGLFAISPKLALLVTLAFPILGISLYFGKRIGVSKIEAYHGKHDAFNFQLLETLRGLFLIQDEVLQKNTSSKLEHSAAELKDSGFRLGVFGYNQSHIQEALISLMGVSILVGGGIFVFHKQMSLGDLLGFYFIVFIIRRYFTDLVRAIPQVQEGFISYKNIAYELEKEKGSDYGSESIPLIKTIQLENLCFWYQPDKVILKDLNYTFKQGEIYLIRGENGSGKTSLFNVLAQNYQPNQGAIVINGINCKKIDKSSVKLRMGILPQSPSFFDRSIKDNILMERTIEKEKFEQAVAFANVDNFTLDLPNQYETQMGDSGVFLSGGQKQKIALARALIKNPDFILLDEPTNHLDRRSINHLIEQLRTLKKPPGIIIISHDDAITSIANTVLTLSDQSLIPTEM